MSVGISIQFLTGRYHATPWNHQVNEGVVDFPPSPWRILRAFVSAYYRLCETPPKSELLGLLTSLSTQLPCYWVPLYTSAHTRHYMPIWKEGKASTTKVIDTFLAFEGGALSPQAKIKVVWQDVELNHLQQTLLKQLCCQINYLGRAESWVEINLIEDLENLEFNAIPAHFENQPIVFEKAQLLVPLSPEEMVGFQAGLSILPKPKKGKNQWQIPADILAALELDVGKLHAQAWNGIPGTRWVPYTIAKVEPPKSHSNTSHFQKPNFARFALASNVLPDLTEAVNICDRIRQALIKHSNGINVFTGRSSGKDKESLVYLQGQEHAWYLPEVNQQGKIEHIVVYAKTGFDWDKAIPALKKLNRLWSPGGSDLQTILISLGQLENYVTTNQQNDKRYQVIGNSYKWHSLTPVVLTRHPKFRHNGDQRLIPNTSFQVDGAEHQALKLLTQLNYLGIPLENNKIIADGDWLCLQMFDEQPIVKLRRCDNGVTDWKWQAFRRQRYSGNGQKSSDNGYWFEIEFSQPQSGPIALGYAAHFGLGTFVPIEP
jgi:CRISPR-associated protein Csb2